MGSLQTRAALVVEYHQCGRFGLVAGVGSIREGCTSVGVIDQAEIGANVRFHSIFFVT